MSVSVSVSVPESEPEKLQLYVSEVRRHWMLNPQFVTSESFFRLWQEQCHPVPFFLPRGGLPLCGGAVFASCWERECPAVVSVSWWHGDAAFPTACVLVRCESGESGSRTVLLPVDEHGEVSVTAGPEEQPGGRDTVQGEWIEAMFEVAGLLKRRYPSLTLTAAKDTLLRGVLTELRSGPFGEVYETLLRCRAGTRKALMRRVTEQMASDEADAQLRLGLVFEESAAVSDGGSPESEFPPSESVPSVTVPARGAWEIEQDLVLLAETESCWLKRERDLLFSLKTAEVLSSPSAEGLQAVRLPCPDGFAAHFREGGRFTVFYESPRQTVGTLRTDVLDGDWVIATIQWQPPEEPLPLSGPLYAMPRKSGREYLVRALEMLKGTLFSEASEGLPALRAILGLTSFPCTFFPPSTCSRVFPSLDGSQASAAAACLYSGNPAVLVQGPPGTGKTTVIEALVRRLVSSGSRVLITAPSNAAVDNISRRLRDLPLLRHSSQREMISAELLPYWTGDEGAMEAFRSSCCPGTGEVHAGTHLGLLRSPEIASRMSGGRLFDVVIFDEAGMSRPSEALLCLCLASRACFFGDPQQLPPFPVPAEVRQAVSERHPAQPLSQRHFLNDGLLTWLQGYRQVPSVLLDICYRCRNPRLMRFASLLFYNGNIKPDPQSGYFRMSWRERERRFPAETIRLLSTSRLPSAVRGEELVLDGRQPGYQNSAEAAVCVGLILSKLGEYPPEEIAVISPYRRQVRLIRRLLKGVRPASVDEASWDRFRHERIATVDSFQGGESGVVIISYVRSGGASVGFIDDPNRVNVTHTRAKSEMTVIGDLDFLQEHSRDRIFRRMARNFRRDGVICELDPERFASEYPYRLEESPSSSSEA